MCKAIESQSKPDAVLGPGRGVAVFLDEAPRGGCAVDFEALVGRDQGGVFGPAKVVKKSPDDEALWVDGGHVWELPCDYEGECDAAHEMVGECW